MLHLLEVEDVMDLTARACCQMMWDCHIMRDWVVNTYLTGKPGNVGFNTFIYFSVHIGVGKQSQLDWITRVEQFLGIGRISKRMLRPQGNTYYWLAGLAHQPRQGQQHIIDHLLQTQEAITNRTNGSQRGSEIDPPERSTEYQGHLDKKANPVISWWCWIQTQTILLSYFQH